MSSSIHLVKNIDNNYQIVNLINYIPIIILNNLMPPYYSIFFDILKK